MDEIVRLRKANPGGGPHSITGPIYVEGAEPGDTLEIHILKIVPKADGFNFNVPGKDFPTVGQLASEFPEGFVRYFKLDLAKMQTPFKPGIVIDLKPFPGTFAVGVDPNEPDAKAGPPIHDAKGRTSTLRPWKNGSNMDVNELQAGSTMYFPVFQKGGLIWTGDSHCRQGNGEVNLTALECSYKEIEIKPIVRKDMKTDWPWAETKTDWIFMGFDEDLNQAMKIAVDQTVNWLSKQTIVPMSREEAYALTSIVGDCRVSQVVDIRKGVHCMIPKVGVRELQAGRALAVRRGDELHHHFAGVGAGEQADQRGGCLLDPLQNGGAVFHAALPDPIFHVGEKLGALRFEFVIHEAADHHAVVNDVRQRGHRFRDGAKIIVGGNHAAHRDASQAHSCAAAPHSNARRRHSRNTHRCPSAPPL